MFRFRDRWQTSLGELYRDRIVPSATDRFLALLEDRDRDLEDHLNGAVDWTAPTFLNGWTNFGAATHTPLGYRRMGDLVHVCGVIAGGTSGAAVCNLPAGHRPRRIVPNPCLLDPNVVGRVDVEPDGDVVVYVVGSGTNAYAAFNFQFSVTQ